MLPGKSFCLEERRGREDAGLAKVDGEETLAAQEHHTVRQNQHAIILHLSNKFVNMI
jgi:hypothetical protein